MPSADTPSADKQRQFAVQVVRQLRQAGYDSLWAGGCVRDQLLGRTPKDFDVATNALPEQVRALFGKRRTLPIGAAFGVVVVLGHRPLEPIEVATFRSDGSYLDGRRPQEVVFTTAEQDAQRRDFTINGLFYDPLEERVLDYVQGQQDLERGMIRAIGDPIARFREDKLRMLRAVRFATNFGFDIDRSTQSAIEGMAEDVTIVSAERIGAELRRMLIPPTRSQAIWLLQETNLLKPILPEFSEYAACKHPVWQRTLERLERLETSSLPTALATLWYEMSSLCTPSTEELIADVGHRLRYTNKEIKQTLWLINHLPLIANFPSTPWPDLQPLLVDPAISDLLAMADAILLSSHAGVMDCREKLTRPMEQLNPEPLLAGADLIAHGIPPGPNFRLILKHVRDQQLLGHVSNLPQALASAQQWINQSQHKGGS